MLVDTNHMARKYIKQGDHSKAILALQGAVHVIQVELGGIFHPLSPYGDLCGLRFVFNQGYLPNDIRYWRRDIC